MCHFPPDRARHCLLSPQAPVFAQNLWAKTGACYAGGQTADEGRLSAIIVLFMLQMRWW